MIRRTALGIAASLLVLSTLARPAAAQDEPLKPYIVFILDVSGSMDTITGFGPPSCVGTEDTRLDHAKCAIANIQNSYGDMVMALGRFRTSSTDVACTPWAGNDDCTGTGIDCDPCDEVTGVGCTAAMSNGDRFELLVPLEADREADILRYNDFTCATCAASTTLNSEIYHAGFTPIAGSLVGAKRYWQGLASPTQGAYWPTAPGNDPIRNDPKKNNFLPSGEQCRPYVVISLTDGDETCTTPANTVAAAASMLSTVVDTHTYRIETKPIGFGKNLGDAEIEAIAHAGGAQDLAGFEGAYANNEEELSLAIAQIIADVLRVEKCNGADDDCDGDDDEDFPLLDDPCVGTGTGICQQTGVYICNDAENGVECMITDNGDPAGTEVCNDLDDDCDGNVDEGTVCVGCGDAELCNGDDDDCDGQVDEDLTRACGTEVGACTSGLETCNDGDWEDCTATGPFVESCNGIDDDCNGVPDGFQQECSTLPGGNPEIGACQPGQQVCSATGGGTWGPCLGEIVPDIEGCDSIDNDCDVDVDEDTGGADCSTTCGLGFTVCFKGDIQCTVEGGGGVETCNGLDDDCDTVIDEDQPSHGDCFEGPSGEELCMPGELLCVGGEYRCIGGEQASTEICDCLDNDCDDQTDEEPPALCASGATCTSCQCAYPCATGEFPCPVGRYCSDDNFCLIDPCYGIDCQPDGNGDQTECVEGDCVRSCDLVTCDPGLVCRGSDALCVQDDCAAFPEQCTADQLCLAGTCIADPCAEISCTAPEYCAGGTCITSCAGIDCPDGQRCVAGGCEADPCGGPCTENRVCNEDTGQCVDDPCIGEACEVGEVCDTQSGECVQDPCLGVTCPGADEICLDGTCYDPEQINPRPDAGPEDYVAAGGGGGCTAGGGAAAGAVLLAMLALVASAWRSRRQRALIATEAPSDATRRGR